MCDNIRGKLIYKEIIYIINMNDDKRAVEIENNSAKVLNSKKVCEDF